MRTGRRSCRIVNVGDRIADWGQIRGLRGRGPRDSSPRLGGGERVAPSGLATAGRRGGSAPQGRPCGPMMETALQWVAHYGYVAIFSLLVLGIIGLPIPDETLLLFVGYLIYRGQLRPIPSLISAFLGSLCWITLSYAFGRTFGLHVVKTYD